MQRRRRMQGAVVAAVLGWVLVVHGQDVSAEADNRAAAQPPHIILILLDDLGWGDVGYHGGNISTPNIDRLAQGGIRQERMYTFPICTMSRAALITGRSPIRMGLGYRGTFPWDERGLPLDERTIAQTLRARGYFTTAVGKWHLGQMFVKQFPTSRGFDHFYGFLNGMSDYFTRRYGDPVWDKKHGGGLWGTTGGIDWQRNGETLDEEGYTTDLLADEAVRLIENHDASRPLFMYLAFNAPHLPLQAPEELIEKYAHMEPKERRIFAAMVDSADTAIGRVIDALERKGMTQDTLVWAILSDNGGYPGHGADNSPLRGRKGTTYEGGLLAPTVMCWPGRLPAGAVLYQVLSVMDVLPTLAAVASVEPGNTLPLDGRNMWPAISSGKVEPREDIFFAVDDPGALDRDDNQLITRLAVLHGQWKMVRQKGADGTVTNELFQIARDPNEQHDLSADHPDLVNDLVERIDQWEALHPPDGLRWGGWQDPKDWTVPQDWAESARQRSSAPTH